MKISMWMIGDKLGKYRPKFDIHDGTARITGVRFLTGDRPSVLEPQFVYLRIFDQNTEPTVLMNGNDRIILQNCDMNEILNDLLAIFDFYNAWETTLWEATATKSLQQIVDLSLSVLNNPIMITAMDGSILAMSSAFLDKEVSSYWRESRETGCIPSIVLGSPLLTMEGKLGAWTDTPQVHLTFDGMKAIGMQLWAGGEPMAVLVMLEYRTPFTHSDIWLIKILCDVLSSTISPPQETTLQRSTSAVIEDLLSGYQIDESLLNLLDLSCKKPWRLIVIENPFRKDVVNKQHLVQKMLHNLIPCVPLLFDAFVVALVSDDRADDLLNSVLSGKEMQYYQTALSLPYDNLHDSLIQYNLALSILRQTGGKPGVFHGEAYALPYLLSMAAEQTVIRKFTHPALRVLKQHDEQKNSLLYETLYQYLLHERSIQLGANAMHVHKNSFLYRLQRIRDLTNVDLEDPMTRVYLLLSYLLEQS